MKGVKRLNVEYFSEELEGKLSEIVHFPCTLIEAPSGFGKTTAVKHYLQKMADEGAKVLTYRFLPENSVETSWEELCNALYDIQVGKVSKLKAVGYPNEDSLADIRHIIQDYTGDGKTAFFFIDDFQAFDCEYAVELIDYLAGHQVKGFHIIIASHPFSADQRAKLVPTGKLYHLSEEDFVFNKQDVTEYYKSAGIELSEEEVEDVMELTGGWAIALYLQLDSYVKKGSFEHGGMDALMEKTVWNSLSDKDKNTYLQLSVLPSFTLSQAVGFSGDSMTISEKSLRETHYFIQYSKLEKRYYLHTQLKKFLNGRFELLSEDEKKEIYHTAGKLCWEAGDHTRAIRLLYLSGYWSEIYELPTDITDFSAVNETYTVPMIIDLMEHSDKKDTYAHPGVPIYMMFTMFMMGHNEEIIRFAPKMRENIRNSSLSEREKEELMGELELLLSFLRYNRIDAMCKLQKKAWDLLQRQSKMFNCHGSWSFGSPSILYLYWREAGKLSEELDQMDECMPIYCKLSGNHGAGAEIIARAEAELNRGNYDKAEIGAFRGIFDADSKEQTSIAICGSFILARIALLTGNKELLSEAETNLKNHSGRKLEDFTRYTYDMADGFIAMIEGDYDRIKPWLKEGKIDAKHLTFTTQAYAFIIYESYLLNRQEYTKLLGISQVVKELSSTFPNLLSSLYTSIFCAAAYEAIGQEKEATEELKTALDMGIPDKMYLPFAENFDSIRKILVKCHIKADDRICIERIARNLEESLEVMGLTGPKLSDREKEVLSLIKQGLTNSEIAKAQLVSLSTVKKQVSSILLKYGLASREQLKIIN